LGAAQRTLDGEDRSERIAEEGKAGRKFGETWAAKMVPSPTASNAAPASCYMADRPYVNLYHCSLSYSNARNQAIVSLAWQPREALPRESFCLVLGLHKAR